MLESGVSEVNKGASTYVPDETGSVKVMEDERGKVTLLEPAGGDHGHGKVPNTDEPQRGRQSEEGAKAREASTGGEKRRPRGGFSVDYEKAGKDAFRARWAKDKMTIFLNLEYPELSIFKDTDDPRFKAISGEIAISEYAVATVNLEVEHGYVDVADSASEALIEYRRIVNRVGRKIAPLVTRWFGADSGQSPE